MKELIDLINRFIAAMRKHRIPEDTINEILYEATRRK